MNGRLKYYVLLLSVLLFGVLIIFRPSGVWFDIIFYSIFINNIVGFVLFSRFVVAENVKFSREFFRKNKTDDEADSESTE